jgi:nucleoside phosphorylase
MVDIDKILQKSANFLKCYAKDKNGYGFFAQEPDSEYSFCVATSTANAILALFKSDFIDKNTLSIYIDELLNFQFKEGNYKFCFCKEERPSCWATAKSVYVILETTPEKYNSLDIQGALKWLIENKNIDNGWGYIKGKISRPFYTFYVLQVLSKALKLDGRNQKKIYENQIQQTYTYLINSYKKEYWSNGTDERPCPINSLFAVASLKIISETVPSNDIYKENLETIKKETFDLINDKLKVVNEWSNLSWKETQGGYTKLIEPFPPGKVDVLLYIDRKIYCDLIKNLIGYLYSNIINVDDNNIGWKVGEGEGLPYSWTTAKSMLSFLEYKNAFSSKKEPLLITDKNIVSFDDNIPTAIILTAIKDEYLSVRKRLVDIVDFDKGDTSYEKGKFIFNNKVIANIIIRECGAKNTIASQETERVFNYFSPDMILFVGIAGSRKPKDFKIGDVIFPDKVYYYEGGKALNTSFKARPDSVSPSFDLIEKAKKERIKNDWKVLIDHEFVDEKICADIGIIASGEQLIEENRSDICKILDEHYNDTSAVEMEGYGFLKAIERQGKTNKRLTYGVVRGISDIIGRDEIDSDNRRPENIKKLASASASAFAYWLIYKTLGRGY